MKTKFIVHVKKSLYNDYLTMKKAEDDLTMSQKTVENLKKKLNKKFSTITIVITIIYFLSLNCIIWYSSHIPKELSAQVATKLSLIWLGLGVFIMLVTSGWKAYFIDNLQAKKLKVAAKERSNMYKFWKIKEKIKAVTAKERDAQIAVFLEKIKQSNFSAEEQEFFIASLDLSNLDVVYEEQK